MRLLFGVTQGVVDVERQLGGTLVDSSKHVLFQFSGGNLSLSIDHIGYGWRLKQTAGSQVCPSFYSIEVCMNESSQLWTAIYMRDIVCR